MSDGKALSGQTAHLSVSYLALILYILGYSEVFSHQNIRIK